MNSGNPDRKTSRILVVDDDSLFRESLVQNLADAGFSPMAFADGPSALQHLADSNPADVILLDWKMPEMTGIDVLRHLRERRIETPVVFLTALSDQFYEEAGLIGGAVDFIDKSRNFSILARRLDLILDGRKASSNAKTGQQPTGTVMHGNLQLRRDTSRTFWRQKQVDLTLAEFHIVEHLVMNAGRDVRYRELYDMVRGEGFAAGSGEIGFRVNVRSFIKRIRQKFRDVDPDFVQIENYPGFGYRWNDADAA